jgi:hypothetical protein
VAGGFLYIGAVAVLPTFVDLSLVTLKSFYHLNAIDNFFSQAIGGKQKWFTGASRGTQRTNLQTLILIRD